MSTKTTSTGWSLACSMPVRPLATSEWVKRVELSSQPLR